MSADVPGSPGADHTPVLAAETVRLLRPRPGDVITDATIGPGGHALTLLPAIGPRGRLIGIDRDPQALALAGDRLARWCREAGWSPPFPWELHAADFAGLSGLLERLGAPPLDGLLLDLGVSSLQLDTPGRGFSFRADAPLDMRMDPGAPRTAADLVNTAPESDLARILWEFGEERHSRRIAREIVERRPLRTTRELAELVARCYPAAARQGRIHPATRSFQALRIAVNEELTALAKVLDDVPELLAAGGRLVVLSYHSLEDRIVKRSLEYLSGRCRCDPRLPACVCGAQPFLRILTRKPLTCSPAERQANPRARSVRLRAAERT